MSDGQLFAADGSGMAWSAYQPLEKARSSGDREVTCFLGERGLTKVTGSAKGSKR